MESNEENSDSDDRLQKPRRSSKRRRHGGEDALICTSTISVDGPTAARPAPASLPFGIANVLQSSPMSPKPCSVPVPTSVPSTSVWLTALHHLSQSSSTAALANASNWCAKCSMQFRLTSELVHHIRVHHATRRHPHPHSHRLQVPLDTTTTLARKTVAPTTTTSLTCPICTETFRERHHLTRHMTSHR